MNPEHYALPFVHPVTGEHMTSYCCLMKAPITFEIRMTAFGKEFGGMCQGNNKTGIIGTKALFIMDPKDVPSIPLESTANCTQRWWSPIGHKRRIPIASESQPKET
jgi:hypothetical protein